MKALTRSTLNFENLKNLVEDAVRKEVKLSFALFPDTQSAKAAGADAAFRELVAAFGDREFAIPVKEVAEILAKVVSEIVEEEC